MEIRPAAPADRQAIEDVARQSLQASYALSPGEIDALVAQFFAPTALDDRLDAGGLFVAEHHGEVVGFATVDAEDTLRWLHVDPEARGQGAGTQLMERVRTELTDRGSPLTARILDAATEGVGFLERFGLTETDTATLAFDGEQFPEDVYTTTGGSTDPTEPSVDVPETVEGDGETVRVDRDEPIPGIDAPFFPVFTTDAEASRWGFFCGACGSIEVAADGLDRLECGDCGNAHRADQWDEAYL